MNYQAIYNRLVANSISKDAEGENHHIVPRCMGGTDDKSNIVRLTYRQHFIAHLLLAKINHIKLGLAYAVARMSEYGRYNSKEYSRLRKKLLELQRQPYDVKFGKEKADNIRRKLSKINKGKTYEEIHGEERAKEIKNKLKGRTPPNKGIPNSEETRKKLSNALKGRPAHNKGIQSPHKGKTYEEIHGEERAVEIKQKQTKHGKPHTEETKEKLREKRKLQVCSDEQRLKQSLSHKGKPWSDARRLAEETRKKHK